MIWHLEKHFFDVTMDEDDCVLTHSDFDTEQNYDWPPPCTHPSSLSRLATIC